MRAPLVSTLWMPTMCDSQGWVNIVFSSSQTLQSNILFCCSFCSFVIQQFHNMTNYSLCMNYLGSLQKALYHFWLPYIQHVVIHLFSWWPVSVDSFQIWLVSLNAANNFCMEMLKCCPHSQISLRLQKCGQHSVHFDAEPYTSWFAPAQPHWQEWLNEVA